MQLTRQEKARIRAREWYAKNKERAAETGRKYRRSDHGRAIVNKAQKEWRRNNPEKAKASGGKWRASNPGKVRAKYLRRREEILAKIKARRIANLEAARQYEKEIANRRLDKKRASNAVYRARTKPIRNAKERSKYRSDLQYKLRVLLRTRLTAIFRGKVKSGSGVALLGCTPADALRHIESQFLPGMTWENWGRISRSSRTWNIDHRIPLTAFDLTNPDHLASVCHFSNLQPMWAIENIRKYNRISSMSGTLKQGCQTKESA